jgi:hypothetical protein
MTAPRDWDKELAEIDKLMSNQPALPAGSSAPAKAQAPPRVAPAASAPVAGPVIARKAKFGTWLQVLLGLVLGAAMTQWPYAHQCGTGLFLYLGAAGLVTLAGLWTALGTWHRRMGLAHALSLAVALWGFLLIGAEVLPRIGYARVAATWMCR